MPLFHANAWGFPYIAMLAGTSLVMPDRFLQAEPLAAMIEAEKVSTGAGVPTIWNDLLRYLDEHPEKADTCCRLMVGGSAAPPAMIRAFQERHDIDDHPRLGDDRDVPGRDARRSRRPRPRRAATSTGATARPRAGSSSASRAGSSGRTARSSRGTASRSASSRSGARGSPASYFMNGTENDTDRREMAAKFSDDGWLRTGDVGALSKDGFLYLTDRSKDVIKSGGEWISSVDLENALMGHPVDPGGHRRRRPRREVGRAPARLGGRRRGPVRRRRTSCADFLEGKVAHWQVPERWAFIDEVPKTSVGKFDKKVIRKRYADGELDVKQLG